MALQAQRIKAVLFDIDGTLSDSDNLLVQQVERALTLVFRSKRKRLAVARRLAMAIESPFNSLYHLADRFNLDRLIIRLLNWISKKKIHREKNYWIIPGVKRLLEDLFSKYALGVISAGNERTTLAFLRQFNLEKYFKVIVSSQTCLYTKPFPDPLLYAAEKLAVEPEACLMVGDTTVDIKAAKLAGMQALGVLCGFGRRDELERAGADQILTTTADLKTLLSL
ncbi:MAG: HAD family hydrolase [Anaerolineaceae bacterium]|nr:HAD family hydrolase [Anaerolineaceae bacterium]